MNYPRINKGLIIIKGINLFYILSYRNYFNSNFRVDLIIFSIFLKLLQNLEV
jgi:hypothetical protein